MFLSKSTSGIYYLYYNDSFGKRQKISTRKRTKSEALQFLQSFTSNKNNIRLEKFTAEFFSYAESVYQPKTLRIYKSAVTHFLSLFGNVLLTSVTPHHWDKYRSLRVQEISPTSVNIELRTLKSFFNIAYRWNLISNNPFAHQQLLHIQEQRPLFLSQEELYRLLLMIKEQWLKDMILFSALTGLRRGELLNLRWTDVNMRNKYIVIQSSPTFKTKNGKQRIIPLNTSAFHLLQTKKKNGIIVFTDDNGNSIHAEYLTKKFKKYICSAHLDKKLHWHSLRHTFASWLIQKGTSIYEVQHLLGHSTVAVTQIYAHLQTDKLHKTVNRINLTLPK